MNTTTRLTINGLRIGLAGLFAFPVLSNSLLRAADTARPSIKQAEDGSIKLGAADVKIQGPNAQLEGGEVKDIMWWTSADTTLRWTASVQKPGRYRVELTYAIIGNNNGSPLTVMIGNQVVKAIPKAGSGFNDYKTGTAGEVTISESGDFPVVVKPLSKSHEFVITIRSVSLLPADSPTEAIEGFGRLIEDVGGAGSAEQVRARLGASLLHLDCGVTADGALEVADGTELDLASVAAAGGGLVVLPPGCFLPLADRLIDAGFSGVVGWRRAVPEPVAAVLAYVLHSALADGGRTPAEALREVRRWIAAPKPETLPPLLAGHAEQLAELSAEDAATVLIYRGR